MQVRTAAIVVVIALMVSVSSTSSAAPLHHETLRPKSDPITGEWDALFEAPGTTIPITLKLKLDGDKVTGTSESPHAGPGTVKKGSWSAQKLSFTIETAHASIAVTGILKDGKLVGEYDARQMHGKWEAKKK